MQFCKTNDLCDIKPEDLDNDQVMIRKDVRNRYSIWLGIRKFYLKCCKITENKKIFILNKWRTFQILLI